MDLISIDDLRGCLRKLSADGELPESFDVDLVFPSTLIEDVPIDSLGLASLALLIEDKVGHDLLWQDVDTASTFEELLLRATLLENPE